MTRQRHRNTWSDWHSLDGWNPSPEVLAETLDGGQSFRWFRDPSPSALRSPGDNGRQPDPSDIWTGSWSDQVIQIRIGHEGLEWRGNDPSGETSVRKYLGLDTDWTALTDSLPWRSDAHLAHCIGAFPGLRILRQPFGETLLGFLCSATKQIIQIKQMCALLAEKHGSESGWARPRRVRQPRRLGAPSENSRTAQRSVPAYHRLPTWPELVSIPEAELRACLLGFRARYISETAKFLAARPGWLDETEQLPYADAKTRLLELPGVGEKIADCVLLFGAGRLEAFPVDTWVLKSLARRYGLDGWKPDQVAHFGRTHFGPLAGLAQQYLFSWERRHGQQLRFK